MSEFIIAEELGNFLKYYNSNEELILENIESIFEYGSNPIIIGNKISEEDVQHLLHPANKTYGYIIVRYLSAPSQTGNTTEVFEYAFPFNDEAIKIIEKYDILHTSCSYDYSRKGSIGVIDLDQSYKGSCKVENFDYSDDIHTLGIRLALFSLNKDKLDYMLNKIKTISNHDITVIGKIKNELTDSLNAVIEHSASWKSAIDDILIEKLGVVKLESSW